MLHVVPTGGYVESERGGMGRGGKEKGPERKDRKGRDKASYPLQLSDCG